MSLMIFAPESRAACATSDLVVSIEIKIPVRFLNAVMTGMTRLISSSAEMDSEPGLVLSPPISIMSEPSSTSWSPFSKAFSLSK